MLSTLLAIVALHEVANLTYVSPTGLTGLVDIPEGGWHNKPRHLDLISGHASPLPEFKNATMHRGHYWHANANEKDEYIFCADMIYNDQCGRCTNRYVCSNDITRYSTQGIVSAGNTSYEVMKSPMQSSSFFGPGGRICLCEHALDHLIDRKPAAWTRISCDGDTLFHLYNVSTLRMTYRPDTNDFFHRVARYGINNCSGHIVGLDGTIKYSINFYMEVSPNGKYGISDDAIYSIGTNNITKIKNIDTIKYPFPPEEYGCHNYPISVSNAISNDGAYIRIYNSSHNPPKNSDPIYNISLEYPEKSVHIMTCSMDRLYECPLTYYVSESTYGLIFYENGTEEGTVTKIYTKEGGSDNSDNSGGDEMAYIVVGTVCLMIAFMFTLAALIKYRRRRQAADSNGAYESMT